VTPQGRRIPTRNPLGESGSVICRGDTLRNNAFRGKNVIVAITSPASWIALANVVMTHGHVDEFGNRVGDRRLPL
jgi:hypothetical protein